MDAVVAQRRVRVSTDLYPPSVGEDIIGLEYASTSLVYDYACTIAVVDGVPAQGRLCVTDVNATRACYELG